MKNFFKKMSPLIFSMLFIINATVAVAAPTSDTAGEDCRLTFSVTDKTGGIFINDIRVTLLNSDASLEYNYTITSGDYLFGIAVGGNVKQGDYMIALNYANKEKYTVQNADGTPITSFTANSAEHTFDWVIVYNGDDTTTQTQDEPQGTADNYVTKTGNKEADEVWNAFLEAIAPVETDSQYAPILKVTHNTANTYSKYYEQTSGNSRDEYLNMSAFEQFLWDSTYVVPVLATTYGDYDMFLGSLDKFYTRGISQSYLLIKDYGSDEMLDAYETLMEWDYNYFLEHGAMYNFLTGKSSVEENSALEVVTPDDDSGNNSGDLTDEEIQEVLNDLTDEEIAEIKAELEGNDGNTSNKVLVIAVIVLVLFGGAVIVAVYLKKKQRQSK